MIPILTSDALINQPAKEQMRWFPYISCNKLIFLEIISLGLYSLLWWYALWKHYKKSNDKIKYIYYLPTPVLVLLSPLLGLFLFKQIATRAQAENIRFDWDPTIISIIYFIGCLLFVISIFNHLHFPFLFITWGLRILPLYFIQHTINLIREKYPLDVSFNPAMNFNAIILSMGGIAWSIILMYMFIFSLPPLTLAHLATQYQSYNLAHQFLLNEAYKGNAKAQSELANLYMRGLLENDNNAAITWYERAAEQNDPHAILSLGKIYQYGLGIRQDYNKAIYYYQLAVQHGINAAKTNLAKLYEYNSNQTESNQMVIKLYQQAADAGDPQAQFLLGLHYLQGKGVPYNIQNAIAWFTKAANQGCPCAQNALGILLAEGTGGTARNPEKAAFWFQKAIQNPKLQAITTKERLKADLPQDEYINGYVKFMLAQYGNDDKTFVTPLSLPQQAAASALGEALEKKCMLHYDEDEDIEI